MTTEESEGTEATAGSVIVARLEALEGELTRCLQQFRGPSSSEAVHDTRVCIRRLRVVLWLAAPILGRFHAEGLRKKFTFLHRASSELRDDEVMLTILSALPEEVSTPLQPFRHEVEQQCARRAEEVLAIYGGPTMHNALAELRALIVLPIRPWRDRKLIRFARERVYKAQNKVAARLSTDAADASGLHRLRIRSKRLRYVSEVFSSVVTPETSHWQKTAEKMQKRLGDIHDIDMAHARLIQEPGLEATLRAQALAVLRTLRAERVRHYQELVLPSAGPPKASHSSPPSTR